MTVPTPPVRGRGTAENPPNRFEALRVLPVPGEAPGDGPAPCTQLLRDPTRTILARNESPDIGFDVSVNPYRGCEHGCVYCYARPTHEYLGFSSGLDFETRILVKEDAPRLLARALASPRWRPQTIVLSGVTDPYQPAEARLRITRRCLEVLARFRNPAALITKSALVARDADLLAELAAHNAAAVCLSVTTLDPELARRMEPRAPAPARRLGAIAALARASVPVGVLAAPLVPGLTDHEVPRILAAAAEAGATFAGYTVLRLPHAVEDLFAAWLERHYPDRREKVLNRIRDLRGGRLNDPRFGHRMRGKGPFAAHASALFHAARRRAGIPDAHPPLSAAAFRRPGGVQLGLFG